MPFSVSFSSERSFACSTGDYFGVSYGSVVVGIVGLIQNPPFISIVASLFVPFVFLNINFPQVPPDHVSPSLPRGPDCGRLSSSHRNRHSLGNL